MTLLILPIIIVSSQEAIRAVPNSVREASHGLGANKWQTIRRVVLPAAVTWYFNWIHFVSFKSTGRNSTTCAYRYTDYIIGNT